MRCRGRAKVPGRLEGDVRGEVDGSLGSARVDGTAYAQNGIQDAQQLHILGRALGANNADALGLGDDIEVADPTAEGTELGLLATQAHLGEEDLGFEVFLIGEGSGDAGSEIGAI